ncbi:beta strand repeat-containing protein [Rivularia sp. UHCC 0363]|uniref:beta strand repeat-containing protein n=1 Tax=Rivularia sp. UHCC 0363 TaxID=3110244 RepID=UPI003A598978
MMKKYGLYKCLQFGFAGLLGWLIVSIFTVKTQAQQSNITPDNTLGTESSRLNRNVIINGINADSIDGGAQRDINLFHSFSEFNINDGRTVYFVNPSGVENILTRVTGGNASNILGTLGVDGAANLFLINPNGIVFGENARLDLQGSFVGTTANGVQFGEQGVFSATNPEAPGLLTVNPNALFFNQIQANGGITNKSQGRAGINPEGNETTGLRVPDGKSLLLVGGNINLDGGRLRAYEGNIELASVAAPGTIGLDISGDTFRLNVPEDVERGDISLGNESVISIFGKFGGNLVINARNFEISNSFIFAGTLQKEGNPDAQAGDININATDSILLTDDAAIDNGVYSQGNGGDIFLQASNSVSLVDSVIANNIEAGGVGKGGNINITAGSLSLTDGSQIQATLDNADVEKNLPGGQGNAGNININVRDAVTIAGIKDGFNSDISSSVGIGAVGNAGDININADSLSLAGGSEINAKTLGQGNAGNITVNARQNISLDGSGNATLNDGSNGTISTRIISSVNPEAVGNSGNIQLNTGTLWATNGAVISNGIDGKGDAGNIIINARDTVNLVDNIIANNIEAGGIGNGGNINITAGSLSLTDSSEIQAFLRDADVKKNLPGGQGNAGNININVRDAVTISGIKDGISSDISSFVGIGAVGNAGDININTGSLSLVEGSEINAKTLGEGNAGNITVNARQSISLDGSGDVILTDGSNGTISTRIISFVNPEAVGNAGDIQLNTGTLSVTNEAAITSSTAGKGDAGNITINAKDTVTFDTGGYASGTVATDTMANGGDIQVTTGTLTLTNGGQLSSNVLGQGNAGNIFVEARDSIKLDGVVSSGISGIQSSLLTGGMGKGGDIQITTGLLSVTNGAAISATTDGQGDAGNITINASDKVIFDSFDTNRGLTSQVSTTGGSNSVGNGGDIGITTGELLLKNGGDISSINLGKGNAGNIFLDVGDTITFDGTTTGQFTIPSSANTYVNNGNAGNIEVKTGSLFLTNGGQMNAAGLPEENSNDIVNGGNIIINARDTIKLDGASSGLYTVLLRGTGKSGDMQITTGSLSVTNGGELSAFTNARGNAGNININASDTVTFDGGLALNIVNSNAIGDGGDIEITTGSLFLDNTGILSTGTLGKGDAGNIKVDAADSISLSNSSSIDSNVLPGGEGIGGTIDIETQTLTLTSGSQISAAVSREFGNLPGGKGRGGEININAAESVTLSGISPKGFTSGIITLTERGASGDAGNINVTTGDFRITDAALVTATTSNNRNAGDITINADNFAAVNGGQIVNTTQSSGNAGIITLNVKDSVTLSGTDPNYNNRLAVIEEQIKSPSSTDRVSDFLLLEEGSPSGLFASTSADSTGKGGSIFIDPRRVSIENGAKVSVSSDGTGDAGDITLEAGTLQLDNGSISAQTASTQGGNINLQLGELLLLRNNSKISTTAGTAQAGGDGGNININSKFIVAPQNENSDITANAFAGNGGKVTITSSGIFGIESQESLTNKSDITASSELGILGETNINAADTSSIQNSFTELSPNIDTNAIIASSCIARGNKRQENSFKITGGGALPSDRPNNVFVSNYTTGEVRTVESRNQSWKKGDPIIEPQGLYRLSNGELLLSRECSK